MTKSPDEIDALARRWAALYSEGWLEALIERERAGAAKWEAFSSHFTLAPTVQTQLDQHLETLAVAERALEVARLGKNLRTLYTQMEAKEAVRQATRRNRLTRG